MKCRTKRRTKRRIATAAAVGVGVVEMVAMTATIAMMPACAKRAQSPTVIRLAHETWAATRLEAPRKELAPRVVVGRPDALTWETTEGGPVLPGGDGSVRLGGAATTTATVLLNPAVSYSLRASAVGALALDVRGITHGQAFPWEVIPSAGTDAGLEFEQDLSRDSNEVEIRMRAAGPAVLLRLEIAERPLRSRLQVVNARDAALRGFVRRRAGNLEQVLDSLLATGRSEYEWPLAPAPYARTFTVDMASVERHGEDREPALPVAMVVELHADDQWIEVVRKPRGGKDDRGEWLTFRVELRNADGIRLRTEPTGPGASATVAWGMPTVRPQARGSRPDVFIFSLDAVRNDQLGAYGGPQDQTPTIDRLAKESVVFDEARTSRGNTWEGLSGIAYAAFPEDVGVAMQGDLPYRGLRDVAQVFGEAGYLTARLGWTLMPPGMLGHMDIEVDGDRGNVGDDAITNQALRLLDRQRDAPLFVWVHFTSTHYPYVPEARFAPPGIAPEFMVSATFNRVVKDSGPPELLAKYKSLYQACIRQTDSHLADLLQQLSQADRPGGPPMVAVLADHGSHHGERGLWFVHATLARAVLRVPLMIHAPGRIAPSRVSRLARTIDLGPTLLDYAGLPAEGFFGRSLRGLIEGRPEPGRVNIARKVLYGVVAIEDDQFKLIVNPDNAKFHWPQFLGLTKDWPTIEFYDWRTDPDEARNIEAREPLAVENMRRQIGEIRMAADRPITPEVRRLLMQAGYLPATAPP